MSHNPKKVPFREAVLFASRQNGLHFTLCSKAEINVVVIFSKGVAPKLRGLVRCVFKKFLF